MSRQVVESLSLEVFKTQLGKFLSNESNSNCVEQRLGLDDCQRPLPT